MLLGTYKKRIFQGTLTSDSERVQLVGINKEMKKFFPKQLSIVHFLISFVFTLIIVSIGYLIMILVGQELLVDEKVSGWLTIFGSVTILTLAILVLNSRRKSYKKEKLDRISNSFVYIKYFLILITSLIVIGPLVYNIKYTFFEEEPLSESDLVILELMNTFNDTIYSKSDTAAISKIKSSIRFLSDNWYLVQSDKGNFSVEFPMYHVDEKKQVIIINNERREIYTIELPLHNNIDSNYAYQISYFEINNINSDIAWFDFYNDQRDYLLHSLNANLIQEVELDTFDYPARQIRCEIQSSDLRVVIRFYYFDGYFYQLGVITHKEFEFNKSVYRFLNSFKILKKENHLPISRA